MTSAGVVDLLQMSLYPSMVARYSNHFLERSSKVANLPSAALLNGRNVETRD